MFRRFRSPVAKSRPSATFSVIPRYPYKQNQATFTPQSIQASSTSRPRIILMVASVGCLGVLSAFGTSFFLGQNPHTAIAQSISGVFLPEPTSSAASTTLVSGVQPQLQEPGYIEQTRQSFLTAQYDFIDVDLAAMQLQYYQGGEVVFSAPLIAKGEIGTWWQAPPGVYQIEQKSERYFSTVGQVYLPWTLQFQQNFLLHGWPEDEDGSARSGEYRGGGLRLQSNDAQTLYELVSADTAVLVHKARPTSDSFVYEPRVPDLSADHYLVADIENNTVLASSELRATSSIASLTKLMTALVAVEQLALDTTISLTSMNYPTTSIPRLHTRSSASVYSLLELLLLESSNEAAYAIATHQGRDQFIADMNDKAAALGLADTQFTDSFGLDDGNVSTLADLYSLTQYIYRHQQFIFTLSREQADTPAIGGQFGPLQNFNTFGDSINFVGGKVGQTLAAGETAITLYRVPIQGSQRIVAIMVLGSESRRQDTKQLYQYLQDRYVTTTDTELSF